MPHRVTFSERPAINIASLPGELRQAAIDQVTSRLSSWALIRGFAVSGTPFITVTPSGVRVCLPLKERALPFGERGLRVDELPAAALAVIDDVPLDGLQDCVDQFVSQLSPEAALRSPAEYLCGFTGRGVLTLPLAECPRPLPAELAYPFSDGLLPEPAAQVTGNGRVV